MHANETVQASYRERREWLAGKKTRPTAAELKAQYGENWGMSPTDDGTKQREERRQALQQRANDAAFRAECEANGFPADSPVSPSLAALIKGGIA